MSVSGSEDVLLAFHTALLAHVPDGVEVLRNESVPVRVPPTGWVCLRDGDPGPPDFLLSPPCYVYEHAAEVDLVVDLPTPELRDAMFDQLKQAIGAAVAADRTLGGRCDYVLGEAPAPVDLSFDGAETMKAATITVVLTYGLADPLA